ncbi:MAG TPA: hypothetical protein VFY16_11025 [Gemmatimonadaceae bacterium]|nr:hypothetical protein [Gemmatimonadaceae bacterium]
MPRTLALASLAATTIAWAIPASAQTPEPGCQAQSAALAPRCQQSADFLTLMMPQLGAALAGGAPVAGEGGNLGGWGRLSFALRGTGFRLRLPDLAAASPPPAGEPAGVPTLRQFGGIPSVEAAVGLWSGIPLEISNVGGVDFIAAYSFMPTISTSSARLVPPGGSGRFGYGVRVGVLQESYGVPGVAVSYMRRALSSTEYLATNGAGDTLAVRRARLDADSWRLVAAKHFIALGLVAGIGQDFYTAEGVVDPSAGNGAERLATPVPVERTMTRFSGFVSATVNFSIVRFVGEVGAALGGDAATATQFGSYAPDDPVIYGSLGVRVGF